MKTKIFFPIVATMFLVLFVSVGSAFAGWHEYPQWQRNQMIVDRTYQDLNQYVGQSCKVWVQTVVGSVSGGLVYPPQNATYPCSWRTDQAGSPYCVDDGDSIQNASPGEIVQMILTNGKEHTAIVLGISSGGITFVESNWEDDEYVHVREETINEFNSHVSCYSIYHIE